MLGLDCVPRLLCGGCPLSLGYLFRLFFGGHSLGLGNLLGSGVGSTVLSLGLGCTLLGLQGKAVASVRSEGCRSVTVRLLFSDPPLFIAALADEKGFAFLPSGGGRINTLGG